MGMLVVALVTAWGPVAPAQAQCTLCCPNGAAKSKSAKVKPAKKIAAAKKPKKEEYLRAVPF